MIYTGTSILIVHHKWVPPEAMRKDIVKTAEMSTTVYGETEDVGSRAWKDIASRFPFEDDVLLSLREG